MVGVKKWWFKFYKSHEKSFSLNVGGSCDYLVVGVKPLMLVTGTNIDL